MNLWPRAFALVLSAAPAVVLAASMYKWVDADGHTHYTQEPPPAGIQGEELQPPPKVDSTSAEKDARKLEESLGQSEEKRAKEAETKKEEVDQQAKDKQACETSKQGLEQAQRPRVNLKEPDGTERRLTEEEQQQEIKKFEGWIKKYCG